MTLHPLEEGWTPVDAFVLVKVIDGDGRGAKVASTGRPPAITSETGAAA